MASPHMAFGLVIDHKGKASSLNLSLVGSFVLAQGCGRSEKGAEFYAISDSRGYFSIVADRSF
jgi:hypothetical protein